MARQTTHALELFRVHLSFFDLEPIVEATLEPDSSSKCRNIDLFARGRSSALPYVMGSLVEVLRWLAQETRGFGS
ncbi:MAG: hypothetical protein ACR2L2_03040 [Acidobacteriota bacterium]